ncbi:MAG: roadblock/LC7 domain-containing protein [Candidatus Bathyarchaeia archaeon]
MPKTKSKLEKINQENIEINLDEIKPKEPHPQTQLPKTRVKEPPAPTINTVLSELKSKEGIIGYILRNTRSATIDLNDPTKIIDYAVLSSSAIDTGDELSQTFDLGEIKHVIVEGKTAKLLSVTIGENNISVFMDKSVDHNQIYKTLTHTA